jgi:hypothetical protein
LLLSFFAHLLAVTVGEKSIFVEQSKERSEDEEEANSKPPITAESMRAQNISQIQVSTGMS